MQMISYTGALRVLQPTIRPIFAALDKGLAVAGAHHADQKLARSDDPHYYAHTVRRVACEELNKKGLHARLEDGRPQVALSAIIVHHAGVAMRVMRPPVTGGGEFQIPIPGRSVPKQAFWCQVPMIPGIETDNLLLLWGDKEGSLLDTMKLVRTWHGDHRRRSLEVHWRGSLTKQMASMRAADLDHLHADYVYNRHTG